MEGDDTDIIKADIETLTQASHKLAEIMYSQASKDQGGPEAGADAGAQADDSKKDDDEDVVDADFEEVK